MSAHDDAVTSWLQALETRQLADLRFAEVARALRALSSAYVERRHALSRGAALDGRGKRAAFALYYAPLHFLTVSHIVQAIGARLPAGAPVIDLGCGTGACGAAWARLQEPVARVTGVDVSGHAVDEARWTYARLGVGATVRRGPATTLPRTAQPRGIVAGWVLNELAPADRTLAWSAMTAAAREGDAVLVLEPLARTISPWWDGVAKDALALGGRVDEWRVPAVRPDIVARLAQAAGLTGRELTGRSLYIPAR